MRPVALSDDIAVGEMPSREQIAILAKAGFRSLLNVQPDGEVARLINATDAATEAAAAGLAYAHTPVESRRLSDEQAATFADALARLPRPVYACCYSGARAAAAWATAMAPVMPLAEIAATCASAGYDISALSGDIERRHAGLPSVAESQPQSVPSDAPVPFTAPSAASAAEKIIFPRAAGAGGFAVAG